MLREALSNKSAKHEIALAKAEIGAEGIGCEPASAVTLAGLKKLVKQGFVKRNEIVVLILTGHLLKDPDFTLKFHRGDLFSDPDAAIRHNSEPLWFSILAQTR